MPYSQETIREMSKDLLYSEIANAEKVMAQCDEIKADAEKDILAMQRQLVVISTEPYVHHLNNIRNETQISE